MKKEDQFLDTLKATAKKLIYSPFCGRKGKNECVWAIIKKDECRDLEKEEENQPCLKGQQSTGKHHVSTCRNPVTGGFQDKIGRTAVRMWIGHGLDDFWRCLLSRQLCSPTALGIYQQLTSAQLSPDCSALQCGPWVLKPKDTATVTTVFVPQNNL